MHCGVHLENILQDTTACAYACHGELTEDCARCFVINREKLASVTSENDEMREELSAFDPAFFDEIEDLKYDHHKLKLQCQDYEQIVQELSGQLGISSPVTSYTTVR